MTFNVTYQQFWMRRDTEANWAAANPVLHAGEIGVVLDGDTGLPIAWKIGDGSTAWLDLPYQGIPVADGSGANTLTATFDPTPVLYHGLLVRVRAAAANTGAVTFNPNGLGAAPVVKYGGTPLAAGDIVGPGHELLLSYGVGTDDAWQLLNPATATALAGGGGSGMPAHAQYRSTAAINTGATFPTTSATPQITDGADTGASVTIDVADASSDIEITFSISQVSVSGTSHVGFHVFRDSDANAIGGVFVGITGGFSLPVSYTFTIPAGSAGSTTFHLRYGAQSGYSVFLLTLGGVTYHGASNAIGMSAKELPA
jgi:hypothetical protein